MYTLVWERASPAIEQNIAGEARSHRQPSITHVRVIIRYLQINHFLRTLDLQR